MRDVAILYPLFGLALLTFVVLMFLPVARFGAAKRKEIVVDDFKYGESSRVPPNVSIPNRNYMNLLEMPILFYVVCIIIFITGTSSCTAVYLAWIYVCLRVIHSIIHLSYNKVMHRLAAFASSNVVLMALWIVAGINLIAHH